jgi:hypothetical protein
MSLTARIKFVALLLLPVLGCDGGPSSPSAGGSLRVTILGLPSGAAATVSVSGPGGFAQSITGTQTLSQLAPGTYTVTATDVTSGTAQYSPSPPSQTVAISSTQASATVVYSTSSGSLTVNITGIGTSNAASVTVTGPLGYSRLVTASTTLKGLTPGDYAVDATNPATIGCASTTPSPTSQTVTVVAKSTAVANVSYDPTPAGSTVNLCIGAMYLIQSAQNLSGSVPLVQNRPAYLRVFAIADQANTLGPMVNVRLRFFLGGVLQTAQTQTITTSLTSVPTAPDESSLNNSWNYLVPASLIQPDLSIEATVDPSNLVAESNDSDNVLIFTPPDVRAVPALNVTFVPILQTSTNKQGSVTDVNKSAFLDVARSMHPLQGVNLQVRSTPISTSTTLQSDGTGWQTVLDQVDAAAVVAGQYYYGVAKVSYTTGVAGIAYVSTSSNPARAALGWDDPGTRGIVLAHELAHNWGRMHAPCGGPANLDVNFPDPGGLTDSYGVDLSTNTPTLKPPTSSDIMGYCNSKWVSEYTYRGVFDYLAPASPLRMDPSASSSQPTLLVWGHSGSDGLVLEPAFQVTTRPRLPAGHGPYTLELRSDDGSLLYAQSFAMNQVADLPAGHRSFAFAIPMSAAQLDHLASIRVTGEGNTAVLSAAVPPTAPQVPAPGGTSEVRRQVGGRVMVRWDKGSHPMAMVRDPDTGDVLAFGREGEVQVVTGKAQVDLLLSDGVKTRRQRLQVAQ